MQRLFFVLTMLLWTACPVEHADNDTGGTDQDSGVTADAAIDGSIGDAVRLDTAGTDQLVVADATRPDIAGSDAAQADAAGHDSAPGVDTWQHDGALADTGPVDHGGSDLARPDTHVPVDAGRIDDARVEPDGAGVDAAISCSRDDSYEDNEAAAQAKTITVPGTITNLVGCDDDWYAFSAPAGHGVRVTITFVDAQADLDLYIYAASNPARSLDSSASTGNSEQVTAGPFGAVTPLLVEVRNFDNNLGGNKLADYTMTIQFEAAPGNDTCAAAQSIVLPGTGSVVSVSGDTSLAGDDRASTLGCQWSVNNRDVFYTFTTGAAMTGYVFANVRAGWRSVVYVFAGNCGATTDLDCGSAGTYFAVSPSTTYYVVVDGEDGQAGPFDLSLSFTVAPANMSCATAKVIVPALDGTPVIERSLTGGEADNRDSWITGPYCQAAARHAPELFYRVDTGASGAGTLHIALDSPGWEAASYVFAGSCDATADLTCTGEYNFTDPIWYRLPVAANQSYFIVVDGYGDIADPYNEQRGPFDLRVRYYVPQPPLPGGETCAAAVTLAGARGSGHGSTVEGVDNVSPYDMGCSHRANGYDKFYTLTLQPGQTATVRLEHGDSTNQAVLAVAQFVGCEVRINSCLDSVQFDDHESGTLTWTHSGNSAGVYFVIVDATYYYHGEEYDLFWSVTGP